MRSRLLASCSSASGVQRSAVPASCIKYPSIDLKYLTSIEQLMCMHIRIRTMEGASFQASTPSLSAPPSKTTGSPISPPLSLAADCSAVQAPTLKPLAVQPLQRDTQTAHMQ